MKRILSALAIVFILLMPFTSQGAVSNWQKGVTMLPRGNTDYGSDSFKQSIAKAKAANADTVSLVVPYYQPDIHATQMQAGGNTPTDQSLNDAIDYAKSLGMKVALKMQLQPWDGQWSAYINPSDRTTWFKNYGDLVKKYAGIAQAKGVTQFVIGNELISMAHAGMNSTNTQNWNNIIAQVKAIYSGRLTYNANWGKDWFTNEKAGINFWDKLDDIGISAYYELWGNNVNEIKGSWDNWNKNDITPLKNKWGKPILFTEIGYRPLTNHYNHPYSWWADGNLDQNAQAMAYEALFSYWNDQSSMNGVHLWDWSSDPNAGGQWDKNYTPQQKQAETVMKNWFGSAGGGDTGGGSSSSGSYSAVVSGPSNMSPGQPALINTDVRNNSGSASNVLVDIEIYNSSGQRVFQKFFQNQNFSSGQSQSFPITWTPPAAGTYTEKVGIFSNDWSTLYSWIGSAATFNVTGSGGGSTPPPSSISIDIWWPSNGVSVTGVQPFKAMVSGMAIENYEMYWQVDAGGLVLMNNSYVDYPHKEALVDVTGWNWKDNGPYVINFVVKKDGAVLGQKAINIYISR